MVIVSQDHFLYRGKIEKIIPFHRTSLQDSGIIRENLCLGLNRSVSDIELHEVCEVVAIYEFIHSLPEGSLLSSWTSTIAHLLQVLASHVVTMKMSPFLEVSVSVLSLRALLCGSRRSSCSTRQLSLFTSRANDYSQRLCCVFRRMWPLWLLPM